MKLGRPSKPSNKTGTFKQGKSRSQANIAGYEKRLARKEKLTLTTDLYEHIPEKSRRSKIALDLGRDEEFGFTNEIDDRGQEELRARLIGENEDDEEMESDDDEEIDSDAAFEETDEERFADFFSHEDDALQDFVSKLDVTSKKRKAAEDPNEVSASTDTRAPKRRLVQERTEAGAENEFRARSSGLKLNIDDLLAPLASQSSALQSLKASAKILASTSSKAKTLSAPLPQRTQERLDRQAAYEQTKEEVDKWSETMKHIREAEHLSFPLQSQSASRVSNLELTAKFKPTTALESSVDALLKSAKLRDEDIHDTEEAMLQMNQLSVEEVAQRRGELRKMRELMFRAEIKARRVGKIKSQAYRRIKRKEKERLGEKINEGDSQDEEGILTKELDRARERATLRHKHTGKWALQMRNKEGLDEDSRRDIEDMLTRGEKLRRRIKGIGSDESEDGSESQDDDYDDGLDVDGGIERIKQDAFHELRQLNEVERAEGDENKKGKGVFEMKFMKDAMARQMQAINESIDDFIGEVGRDAGDDGEQTKAKLKKQPQKREEERERAKEDGVVEISLDMTLAAGTPDSTSLKSIRKTKRKTSQQVAVVHADADAEDSDGNSEVEAQETALTLTGKGKTNGGTKAFEQRDLVALAFAGDNVVQSFEEAKSREVASDAPREVDTTIPGWGSWAGAGVRKMPPKPQRIKKVAGIDPTTRADFNKKYIIISEKRDKKAGKYLVKDLPYPYTSKAQFERAMENPLGAEWNTRVAFQRGTLPKVVKKPGVIINPLEKLTS